MDAIVRLFGELTYFVVLSDHYDGADFCTTLVYDASRGEENGMLFAHEQAEILQMEDAATSEDTVWNDLERKNGIGRLSKSRASLRHFWRLEKCTGKHPDGGKEPYLPLVGKQFEPHRKRDGQS